MSESATNIASAIVLAGPPGVGKTTVASLVAQRLGCSAADLDALIESNTRRTPAEIIRQDGEAEFREVEARTLEGLRATYGVVSLGGGTLTTVRGRVAARALGPVVGLDASAATLSGRLQADQSKGADRPLLDDETISNLVERRAATYGAVDRRLPAEDDAVSVSERVVREAADCYVVNASCGNSTSRVLVGRGLHEAVAGAVAGLSPGRPVLIVADQGVPSERRQAIIEAIRGRHEVHVVEVPGGEPVKSWASVGDILERAVNAGCGRQSVVVGVGGGATCDAAGLVASLLGRGAPLVMVPTTVVAQVDAAVGGKCAVNLAGGRNLAGAFYPAADVIVDVDALDSLDPAEYTAGLAEVLKIGLIADPALFESVCDRPRLDVAQVATAIGHKANIVRSDPTERGLRKVLNLGHTLGHALESASGLTMRHGDAVAVGIAAVARLSADRGWLKPADRDAIIDGLRRVGLPTHAHASLLAEALPHLGKDKKSDAKFVDLIAIRRPGEVFIERLVLEEIADDLTRSGGES